MAVITVNINIEVDDKILERVLDVLLKATEREVPEEVVFEVKDVGGRLSVKVRSVGVEGRG